MDPVSCALDELADYIIDRHHRYIQGATPALRATLQRAERCWGAAYPAISAVKAIFEELAADLDVHMAKEEHLLFPAIRELARARREGTTLPAPPFVTLLHPIRAMEGDHARAQRLIQDLRQATRQYHPPPEADDAGRECYRQLARFDADLEEHIRLEDDILFPRALELERV